MLLSSFDLTRVVSSDSHQSCFLKLSARPARDHSASSRSKFKNRRRVGERKTRLVMSDL